MANSRTARTATPGRGAGMRASAAAAVPASPITVMPGSASSRLQTPSRTTSRSPGRKTLTCAPGACAQEGGVLG
jgi:hypothetical protein